MFLKSSEQNYRFGLSLSIIIHAAIISLLFFSTISQHHRITPIPQVAAKTNVKAALIDKKQVRNEVRRLKKQQRRKIAEAKRKKLALTKNRQKLAQEKKALARMKLELEVAKEQALAEQQKAVLEKRAAAQQMIAAKKIEQQNQQQKLQLQKAQQQQAKQLQKLIQTEIERTMASIRQQIHQQWLRPFGMQEDLACGLEIKLNKQGEILEVKIAQSSGNAAFDELAIKSTYKAAPFHSLPQNTVALAKFQHFMFTFES